jgi:hypothetical protein
MGWRIDAAAITEIERILRDTITNPEFTAPPRRTRRLRGRVGTFSSSRRHRNSNGRCAFGSFCANSSTRVFGSARLHRAILYAPGRAGYPDYSNYGYSYGGSGNRGGCSDFPAEC